MARLGVDQSGKTVDAVADLAVAKGKVDLGNQSPEAVAMAVQTGGASAPSAGSSAPSWAVGGYIFAGVVGVAALAGLVVVKTRQQNQVNGMRARTRGGDGMSPVQASNNADYNAPYSVM